LRINHGRVHLSGRGHITGRRSDDAVPIEKYARNCSPPRPLRRRRGLQSLGDACFCGTGGVRRARRKKLHVDRRRGILAAGNPAFMGALAAGSTFRVAKPVPPGGTEQDNR